MENNVTIRLLEKLDERQLKEEELFIEVIIGEFPAQQTSSVLQTLMEQAPLQQFNLSHLKRVRRKDDDDVVETRKEGVTYFLQERENSCEGACSNGISTDTKPSSTTSNSSSLPSNDSDSTTSLGRPAQRRSRNGKHATVEVVLCPKTYYDSLAMQAVRTMTDKTATKLVPKLSPITTSEFKAWSTHWPLTFHPNEEIRQRNRGTPPGLLQRVERLRRRLEEDRLQWQELTGCRNSGAVMVNPLTEQVVCSSFGCLRDLAKQYNISIEELSRHPLYTPSLLCIEGVAARLKEQETRMWDDEEERGEEVSEEVENHNLEGEGNPCGSRRCDQTTRQQACNGHQNSSNSNRSSGDDEAMSTLPEDHYLCCGLELFLVQEPDLTSAMALLHSRIRTVVFLEAFPDGGALGSTVSLHARRDLNHRFRVFQVVNS